MGDVIQFPMNDPYVDFKCNEQEMDKFNDTLEHVFDSLQEAYPDIEEPLPVDYVLVAESILSLIMRGKDIEHPLQRFANTITEEFLEEYDL